MWELMPSVSPDSGLAEVTVARSYQMPSNIVLSKALGCVRSMVFTSPAQPKAARDEEIARTSRKRLIFIVFITPRLLHALAENDFVAVDAGEVTRKLESLEPCARTILVEWVSGRPVVVVLSGDRFVDQTTTEIRDALRLTNRAILETRQLIGDVADLIRRERLPARIIVIRALHVDLQRLAHVQLGVEVRGEQRVR